MSAPRLTDGLLRWATERPDALAVEAGHAQWSYAELAQRAQAWAARLGEAGIEPGHRVGLCCEKSAEALAAVYGLLLRGAVHVPLDPDIPPGRLAAIEQRCQLSLVLRDLDGPLQPTAAEPGDGAYILFTSGSTGLPRGVVHSHASGMAFVDWAVRTLAIGPQDRLISWASWQFDLSLLDLFGASMAGATLVIPPPQLAGWQPGLGAWLEQQRISLWYTVPTAPVRLLNEGALPEGGLPALRRLVYAGEPMDPGQAQALQRRLPQTTLYNFYGPTETNVVASYRLPPLAEPLPQRIPIGGPASSARLTLDDGELLVSGPSVMRGYWGEPPVADPYRTGDLVTTSPEGYVFLGRRDRMVKLRGQRIELEEVERCLAAASGVAAVAVLKHGTGESAMLVAWLEAAGEDRPSSLELRAVCARLLPAGMIPTRWHWVDALPRTHTGKTDLQALARQLEPVAR